MPLKLTCHVHCIVLMLLLVLPALTLAEVLCQNRNPAVSITTHTRDFVLHNDGTVTHTKTGLMWMRCSLGQSWDGASCTGEASGYTWADALKAAQDTTFAGYSDWRLPNRRELLSIVEESCWSPSINTAVFPNTPSAWFWSSSPSRISTWRVSFHLGHVYHYGTNHNTYQVRLVRTPQPTSDDNLIAERYLPIEDGSIIRDITTGLEWQRCSLGQTWSVSTQNCTGERLTFKWHDVREVTEQGGFRAPSIEELRTLVYCSNTGQIGMGVWSWCGDSDGDYDSPTITQAAFPNTGGSLFWSASWYQPRNTAWIVSFSNGNVNASNEYNHGAVRLVRGGQ